MSNFFGLFVKIALWLLLGVYKAKLKLFNWQTNPKLEVNLIIKYI